MTLPTLTDLLLEAYENELNIKLQSFWDDSWELYIGDDINGYTEHHQFKSLNEVCEILHKRLNK